MNKKLSANEAKRTIKRQQDTLVEYSDMLRIWTEGFSLACIEIEKLDRENTFLQSLPESTKNMIKAMREKGTIMPTIQDVVKSA